MVEWGLSASTRPQRNNNSGTKIGKCKCKKVSRNKKLAGDKNSRTKIRSRTKKWPQRNKNSGTKIGLSLSAKRPQWNKNSGTKIAEQKLWNKNTQISKKHTFTQRSTSEFMS